MNKYLLILVLLKYYNSFIPAERESLDKFIAMQCKVDQPAGSGQLWARGQVVVTQVQVQ